MSSITDVVIILGGGLDGAEVVNAEITEYLISEGHSPFQIIYTPGGGEKVMTSSLLIGAFNCMNIDFFAEHLKAVDWKTIGGSGSIMLTWQHEDDCQWSALPIWDSGIC